MTNAAPITVFVANERGNAQNCMYPHRMEITDKKSAMAAFSKDLVCAEYRNNYRCVETFLRANALPMDCDNDHSEDSNLWITAEDLDGFFPDVTYLVHYSRHHMKPKGDKSARNLRQPFSGIDYLNDYYSLNDSLFLCLPQLPIQRCSMPPQNPI